MSQKKKFTLFIIFLTVNQIQIIFGRKLDSSVASLGEGGRTALGDTLQEVTPEGKKLWANLQRIVDKRGRTGKKGAG